MSLGNHQILVGTLMILASVLFHVAGLVLLATLLKRIASFVSDGFAFLKPVGILVVGLLTIIALHITEALGWAFIYVRLGEFAQMEEALYFSVTTATTLGYGDLTLSPQWRLLSTFEAVAGLLLFGASTAFLLGLMKGLFDGLGRETG